MTDTADRDVTLGSNFIDERRGFGGKTLMPKPGFANAEIPFENFFQPFMDFLRKLFTIFQETDL